MPSLSLIRHILHKVGNLKDSSWEIKVTHAADPQGKRLRAHLNACTIHKSQAGNPTMISPWDMCIFEVSKQQCKGNNKWKVENFEWAQLKLNLFFFFFSRLCWVQKAEFLILRCKWLNQDLVTYIFWIILRRLPSVCVSAAHTELSRHSGRCQSRWRRCALIQSLAIDEKWSGPSYAMLRYRVIRFYFLFQAHPIPANYFFSEVWKVI